jgi:hypothetical protein
MTPGDLEWEYDPDQTPGQNVRAMLLAADTEGYPINECKEFAFRHIPGAGPSLVVRNIDHVEVSLPKHDAAKYM